MRLKRDDIMGKRYLFVSAAILICAISYPYNAKCNGHLGHIHSGTSTEQENHKSILKRGKELFNNRLYQRPVKLRVTKFYH